MEKPTLCLMNKVAQPAAFYRPQAEADREASLHVARNLMVSELPGAAFVVLTLVYVVASLIGLM